MSNYPPPTIQTERLVLKAITEEDILAYEKHFIDYAVIRPLTAGIPEHRGFWLGRQFWNQGYGEHELWALTKRDWQKFRRKIG